MKFRFAFDIAFEIDAIESQANTSDTQMNLDEHKTNKINNIIFHLSCLSDAIDQ